MIDKLEMFMALARERHFGRAAEACNVSQPTLSSAIKQLEEQFGVRLVERGARMQGLTAEGERVLDWARRIVGDYRSMQAEMRATRRGGLSANARIAVIPTALGMVQELTTSFADTHPDVTFTILSRNSVEILRLIENLEADIGITYLENEPLGQVVSVPLYVERYLFVTASETLFAGREAVTWAEASRQPLCLLTPDMQNRRIINHYMSVNGVEAKPVMETDSVIAMATHIRTRHWSGILPEKLADFLAETGTIRAIPLTGPEGAQPVGVIAARREPHTPLVDALLRHARVVSRPN